MMSNDDTDQLAEADDVFAGMFGPMTGSLFNGGLGKLRPLSRVNVDKESVTVTFDVPGVDKGDVSVTCTQDSLSMEAQARRQSKSGTGGAQRSSVEFVSYSERVQLPVPVDPDRATANFKNGIVVVKLPRVETGKRIRVSGTQTKRE